MILQRVDQVSGPLEVGKMYLVPALYESWEGTLPRWWPVIGPKHNDLEFFDFKYDHYHHDVRFLHRRHLNKWHGWDVDYFLKTPISNIYARRVLSTPKWRRMMCKRNIVEYPYAQSRLIGVVNRHYAGQQCPRGKNGWICPHRHVQLESVAPIDGVITCFLHGLRIDAETGKCIGPVK